MAAFVMTMFWLRGAEVDGERVLYLLASRLTIGEREQRRSARTLTAKWDTEIPSCRRLGTCLIAIHSIMY